MVWKVHVMNKQSELCKALAPVATRLPCKGALAERAVKTINPKCDDWTYYGGVLLTMQSHPNQVSMPGQYRCKILS